MFIVILALALIVVSGLAFYAGTLLFRLKAQQNVRQLKTQQRIGTIIESIQTIAKAMDQQQCNLSEGSIRLFHLLECIPITDKPDFSINYPGLYALYDQVKDLPTHDARKTQSKIETRKQDVKREELEAQFESKILNEVANLKTFTIS